MTSQDIKKQLKEPHFWNIVLTWSARRTEDKKQRWKQKVS